MILKLFVDVFIWF